jgi:Flp pilus assembly protein TadB
MNKKLLLLVLLLGAVIVVGCGTMPQDTAEAEAIRQQAYQRAADQEQARQERAIEHSQRMVQDALDRERSRQTREVITATLPWAVLVVVLAFVAGALATVVMMRRKVAEVEPPARSMMIGRGQVEALPMPTPRGEWLPMLAEPVGVETKPSP